ncbi:MAG TPA: lipopolysaccharide biosynthesis protein [Azospirillum sp.]|nr:lipopolysaccharide biosynthesis protein [Azospirillum sp.]
MMDRVRKGLGKVKPSVLAAFVMRTGAAGMSYLIFAMIGNNASLEVYSAFALIFAITGFCGPLASMGQVAVALRYLPPMFQRQDGRWRLVVRGSLRILSLGIVVFCVIALAFVGYSLDEASPSLLLIVAALVALTGIGEYTYTLQRTSDSVLPSILAKEVLWRVILIGIIGMHIAFGWSLSTIGLATAFLLATALSVSLSVADLWVRLRGRTRAHPSEPFVVPAMQTAMFFGIMLLNTAVVHLDTLILGMTSEAQEVGAYFSAQRTIQVLYFFTYSFTMFASPAISVAFQNGSPDRVEQLSRQVSRTAGACVVVACIILVAFAGDVLAIFRPDFRDHADILRILCIGPLVYTLGGLHSWIPEMCGLETEYLKWRLAVSVVFLAAKLGAALSNHITLFAALSAAEICVSTAVGVALVRMRRQIWAI